MANLMMYYEIAKEIAKFSYELGKQLSKPWVEMQDAAFKAGRAIGMNRDRLIDYNKSVIASTREMSLAYNKSYKEIVEFQQKYSDLTGRAQILNKRQLEYMSGLSNLVDPATLSQLTDEFDKIGTGIERTTYYTGDMMEKAKLQGLNAAKAAKGLADNIKLASQYSFKNGVKDIQNMVLKAQSLRMNMDAVMRAADKFMTIEDSITTAANLQMLGGNFAMQFSNPMAAMYEANADPDKFMDRLVGMLGGKGRYNDKTGEVKFDPVTMTLIRQAAKDLGMAVDDITNPAIAKAQNAAVDRELNKNVNVAKFSKKDREAIENLARTNFDEEAGKHFITFLSGGTVQSAYTEDITEEQLKIAQANQLTEEKLYKDVHNIHEILDVTLNNSKHTQSLKEDVQGAKNYGNSLIADWTNWFFEPFANLFNKTKTAFADGGVVPKAHAAVGTIIPGDSYAGDKVPVMANSGEMILNKEEQGAMFGLLKTLGSVGVNVAMMSLVGSRLGIGGLGKSALMAQAVNGGDAGITDIAQMHMMRKLFSGFGGKKSAKPSLSEFDKEFAKFKGKWVPEFKQLGETIKSGIGNTTRYVGAKFSEVGKSIGNQWSRLSKAVSNSPIGEFGRDVHSMGRYAYESATDTYYSGRDWVRGKYENSRLQRGINRSREWFNGKTVINETTGKVRTTGGLKRNLKARALKLGRTKPVRFLKDTGNLLGKTKYGRLAKIAKAGRLSTLSSVSKTASVASESARTLGTLSKASKALGSAVKVGGRAMPYIGTAVAIGSAGLEAYGAKKAYDSRVADIESSNMSDLEKARAKDDAVKEKNTSYGKAAGTAAGGAAGAWAGGAAGAAIGTMIFPGVGTAIGGLIGGAIGAFGGSELGSSIGGGIGSLFGGNNEKKLKEEEEREIKLREGNNAEVLEVLKQIRDKIGGINAHYDSKSGRVKFSPLTTPLIENDKESSNRGVRKTIGAGSGAAAGAAIGTAILPGIGTAIGGLFGGTIGYLMSGRDNNNEYIGVSPKDGTNYTKVAPKEVGDSEKNGSSTVSLKDNTINLNVNGTIKLDTGNQTTNIDFNKLLDSPEFKRQLVDMVTRSLNERANGGTYNAESSQSNNSKTWNRTGT